MKTIFLDMDLTLARFDVRHGERGTKRYRTEEGFFQKLEPYANIEQVNKAINNGVKVFVLSNSPTEVADKDKNVWLDNYLPAIPKTNRIFNRGHITAERTKASVASDFLGRALNENDILIDDCVNNLLDWQRAGGTAIKKHNRNDKADWFGRRVTYLKQIAELIQSAI